MTRITLIAAVASNGVIGRRGGMPWHLPEDLKHFKRTTLGHPVIMGRRTWDSLGKALPERRNIVVTRNRTFAASGAEMAESLDAALALCAGEAEVFVIGGAELYGAALPLARAIELTEIHRDFEGEARFPAFDRAKWQEVRREAHATGDGMRFDFVRYEPRT